MRASSGAEKIHQRTAPGEALVSRQWTRVQFPPPPPLCPHHALTPEGARSTDRAPSGFSAVCRVCGRCAPRAAPSGRRAACSRRAPPAQPGDNGDMRLRGDTPAEERIGRRDLAQWRSAFGRWLVRVAFTLVPLVCRALGARPDRSRGRCHRRGAHRGVGRGLRGRGRERWGRGSRPARSRPGGAVAQPRAQRGRHLVHRRGRHGGHADPRDGGRPGHGAGLAVVDADPAHGDRRGADRSR